MSKKYRDRAAGRSCKLMLPGVCSYDVAQTVGCHLRFFGVAGMGQKPDDILMIDACSKCHAVLDDKSIWEKHELNWRIITMALMFTLLERHLDGDIKLIGEK